jgi:transcription elongation factor GreB
MNKAFVREPEGDDDEDDLPPQAGEPAPPKNYITPAGFARLKAELLQLIGVERPEVVRTVSWAASNGDRSENGDYIYGKRRLREIDRRIRFLTRRLDIAEVVDPARQAGLDQVFFGARVTYLRNGHIEETGFTIGAGYRYALSDRFAIGPMVDFAFYDSENTALLVGALFWKPVGNLLLVAGPGVEWVDEKDHGHDPHASRSAAVEGEGSSGGQFAFRVGAAYELHAGRLAISPAVGADVIDGHTTMVYAVSFGLGF